MKNVSFSKRALALLTVIVLVLSCVSAAYAAGTVQSFTGDSSNGYVTVSIAGYGGGEFEYNVDGEAGSTTSSYFAQGVRVGAECWAIARDTEEHPFLYWVDEFGGRVYSFEKEIRFTTASRVNFKAYFSNAEETEHVVQYLNYGGNLLLNTTILPKGQKPTVPLNPVVPGFTFRGWSVTSDQVAADEGSVIVTPKFVVNDESYTVEITNDAYVSGAGTYSNFQTVNLSADKKDGAGNAFSYWKTSDGEIVSYERNYSFRINYDVTLTAVFGEDVTPQPVIRTSKIVRDAAGKMITVFAERSVPDGYTVVSHGMLMSTRASIRDTMMRVGAGSDLPTAAIRKVYGTTNENCGTYSLAKTGVSESTTVVARPFVICMDASGNEVIAYGEIIRTTLAD